MSAIINLYSNQKNEISNFLSSFYQKNFEKENTLEWKKEFKNPIEVAEFVGIFIDNNEKFDINMWISLDKGLYINITNNNADKIIRYLFERYPY